MTCWIEFGAAILSPHQGRNRKEKPHWQLLQAQIATFLFNTWTHCIAIPWMRIESPVSGESPPNLPDLLQHHCGQPGSCYSGEIKIYHHSKLRYGDVFEIHALNIDDNIAQLCYFEISAAADCREQHSSLFEEDRNIRQFAHRRRRKNIWK